MLALLLLELLAESCFFFELLNFTLPESVSFNFSSNLLIGLSMVKPCRVFFFFFYLPGRIQVLQVSSISYRFNVLGYSENKGRSSRSTVFTTTNEMSVFRSLHRNQKLALKLAQC